MIRSAITVSLVEEARGGPFVYWEGVGAAFRDAAELGFDAVEIFAPGPEAIDHRALGELVQQTGLSVAAVGTGAGMLRHGLNLTDSDPARRLAARDFIRQMIDAGARCGAPAIVGSMQGKWGDQVSRDSALQMLAESLDELGAHAQGFDLPLLYEPLNRYETNLIRKIAEGTQLVGQLACKNVRLLADLFHMNIEEANMSDALRRAGKWIGHVHFVDSNRQAAGNGHIDYEPIARSLNEIDFSGYLSAEALPLPDSKTAAARTIDTFKQYFPR